MFSINQAPHFNPVAQTGGFAAAARKAHITQPALSNSISTLEDLIGLQLFDRGERPIRLTSGGRDLPAASSEFDMRPAPEQQGRAFCRAGRPVLDLPQVTLRDLPPDRFAGAHFPVGVLDRLVETFDLPGRPAIDIAIECDNVSVVRHAAAHSDLTLPTTPGCVRDRRATRRLVELPIDLKTPTSWNAVTLKKTELHPALASLRTVIDRAARA